MHTPVSLVSFCLIRTHTETHTYEIKSSSVSKLANALSPKTPLRAPLSSQRAHLLFNFGLLFLVILPNL